MLDVEALETFYGPSQALFGVDLSVAAGEAVALMGRNGMGKTTTLRSICRLTPPKRGRVRLDGRDLAGLPAHRAARLGLGLAPEGRRCFPNLSVEENLVATARPGPWDRARVEALFPRLAERRGQSARTLSGGEQQMLAIARILRTGATLVLLDEPTEGLAPVIVQQIRDALLELKRRGLTVLLVEQNFRFASTVADRHYVVEHGQVVDQMTSDEIAANTERLEAFLGV